MAHDVQCVPIRTGLMPEVDISESNNATIVLHKAKVFSLNSEEMH